MGKSSHSKRLDIAFRATALLSRELDVDVAGGAGFRVAGGINKVLSPSFLGRCFSILQYLTRSWCYWKSVNQKKSVKQKIWLLEVIKREVKKKGSG